MTDEERLDQRIRAGGARMRRAPWPLLVLLLVLTMPTGCSLVQDYSCGDEGSRESEQLQAEVTKAFTEAMDVGVISDCDSGGRQVVDFGFSDYARMTAQVAGHPTCSPTEPPRLYRGGTGKAFLCDLGGVTAFLFLHPDPSTSSEAFVVDE